VSAKLSGLTNLASPRLPRSNKTFTTHLHSSEVAPPAHRQQNTAASTASNRTTPRSTRSKPGPGPLARGLIGTTDFPAWARSTLAGRSIPCADFAETYLKHWISASGRWPWRCGALDVNLENGHDDLPTAIARYAITSSSTTTAAARGVSSFPAHPQLDIPGAAKRGIPGLQVPRITSSTSFRPRSFPHTTCCQPHPVPAGENPAILRDPIAWKAVGSGERTSQNSSAGLDPTRSITD